LTKEKFIVIPAALGLIPIENVIKLALNSLFVFTVRELATLPANAVKTLILVFTLKEEVATNVDRFGIKQKTVKEVNNYIYS
jgi:hypothetical protein